MTRCANDPDDYSKAVETGDIVGQRAYADLLRERGDERGADVVILRMMVAELSDEPAIDLMRILWSDWLNRGQTSWVPDEGIPQGSPSADHIMQFLDRLRRYATLGDWADAEPADGELDGPNFSVASAGVIAATYRNQLPPGKWRDLFDREKIQPKGWRAASVRQEQSR